MGTPRGEQRVLRTPYRGTCVTVCQNLGSTQFLWCSACMQRDSFSGIQQTFKQFVLPQRTLKKGVLALLNLSVLIEVLYCMRTEVKAYKENQPGMCLLNLASSP